MCAEKEEDDEDEDDNDENDGGGDEEEENIVIDHMTREFKKFKMKKVGIYARDTCTRLHTWLCAWLCA